VGAIALHPTRIQHHRRRLPLGYRPRYNGHRRALWLCGSLAYLAAWDVHRAKVFGRCEATTGIAPVDRLVEQVNDHRALRLFARSVLGGRQRLLTPRQASIDRLQARWPTLRLIHLPVHASSLNQVEIYFSVVQRKVVPPNGIVRPCRLFGVGRGGCVGVR
jgi:hypothetical protein